MIKSLEHAQAVQARRFASGKRGYSKAVRRWMEYQWKVVRSKPTGHRFGMQADFTGCNRPHWMGEDRSNFILTTGDKNPLNLEVNARRFIIYDDLGNDTVDKDKVKELFDKIEWPDKCTFPDFPSGPEEFKAQYLGDFND